MPRPFLKFYPRDWRSDSRLRMCSLAARGLWIELVGLMHEAEPYGYLLIAGTPPPIETVALFVGRPVPEIRKALQELGNYGVYSMTTEGVLYSRRMLRDEERASEGREHIAKRYSPSRSPNRPPSRSPSTKHARKNIDEPTTQTPDTRKTFSSFTEPRDPPPVDAVDNSPPAPAEPPQAVAEEASKEASKPAFVWTPYMPKKQRPPVAAPTSAVEVAAKYGRPQASPQLEAILKAKQSR